LYANNSETFRLLQTSGRRNNINSAIWPRDGGRIATIAAAAAVAARGSVRTLFMALYLVDRADLSAGVFRNSIFATRRSGGFRPWAKSGA